MREFACYERHPGDAREGRVKPEVRVVAKPGRNGAIRACAQILDFVMHVVRAGPPFGRPELAYG